MGLFDKFPYSNSHQLNLDWIIKAIKGDLPEGGGEGSPSTYPYSNSHQLNLDWIIRVVKTTIESAVMSINGKTGDVRLTAEDVNALPDTVTTLPNPHKLTFTGGATGAYDGSAPVTINVTGGGGATTTIDGKSGDLTLAGLMADNRNNGIVKLSNLANQGADKSGMYLAVDSSGDIVTAPGGGGSSGVASVNGKTGIVTLTADDVHAVPAPSESADKRPLIYNPTTGTYKLSVLGDWAFADGTINTDKLRSSGEPGKALAISTTAALGGGYRIEPRDYIESIDGYSGSLTFMEIIADPVNYGTVAIENLEEQGTVNAGKVLTVGSDGHFMLAEGGAGGSGTNPNLLDNPWFINPVNQVGDTTYTGTSRYTIDRWRTGNAEGSSLTVNDGYITVSNALQQIVLGKYTGATLTTSVKLLDGTIEHRTATIPSVSAFTWIIQGNHVGLAVDSRFLYFYILNGTVDVVATKLEYGSVSTLANDSSPNYATELIKCQRFQRVLDFPSTYAYMGSAVAGSTSSVANVSIPLSTPMYDDTPSVVWLTGSVSSLQLRGNDGNTDVSAIGTPSVHGNVLILPVTASSRLVTVNPYALVNKNAVKILINGNL